MEHLVTEQKWQRYTLEMRKWGSFYGLEKAPTATPLIIYEKF